MVVDSAEHHLGGGLESQVVLLLVPMAVIDELDRLKESSSKHPRSRARRTLKMPDRLFPKPTEPAILHADADGNMAGVELLFDEAHHERLSNTDDEIIDRLAAVEPLAARRVTLFTYDTGQHMRARKAGLHTVKLDQEADLS